MLHMLQWLYTYVTSLCSKCFICFSDVCCKYVYLHVAYILHNIGSVLSWMLHIFCNDFLKCFQVFLQVFQTHVVKVLSECFKSRSGVATRDPSATAACCSCWGADVWAGKRRGHERSPHGVGWRPPVGVRNKVQARSSRRSDASIADT
jgi:hypothetical protein